MAISLIVRFESLVGSAVSNLFETVTLGYEEWLAWCRQVTALEHQYGPR
jgi:hypothetical protein